jgi:ankyrin repeat protein
VNESYLYLGTIAKNGSWDEIDYSKISKGTVNRVFYGLLTKKTNLIGIAAQNKKLDKFPKELLNKEGLSCANQDGETALHFICSNNQLKFIPPEFLDEENLLKANNFGTTPINSLCYLGQLSQLPKELISDKTLSADYFKKHSCLDFTLFALEDNSVTAKPERNQEHLKKQMELIISKLSRKSLEKELDSGTESICYQKKVTLVKKELIQRKLMKEVKEKESLWL